MATVEAPNEAAEQRIAWLEAAVAERDAQLAARHAAASSTFGNKDAQPSHASGNRSMISSGASNPRCEPRCPFWPPRFLPDFVRDLPDPLPRVPAPGPSLDGGRWELREFRPSSSLSSASCSVSLAICAACYQQLELCDHRRRVREWRRHEVECERCGAWTRAPYDPKTIPSVAFGPCLTAVVALLTGAYHLSRRKTRSLLHELFGISVSLGAISGMEKRASEALKSAHAEALHEVQHAQVKHSDATTWTRSGKLMSLWVLATTAATAYVILGDGRSSTIRPSFGPLKGILVSDRATVFNFWSMHLRQVCHAHLLRKFVAFSERTGVAGDLGRGLR